MEAPGRPTLRQETVLGSLLIFAVGAVAFVVLSGVLHGPRPPRPQQPQQQQQQASAPPPAVRPAGAIVPSASGTPTADADARDAQRRADLQRIAQALQTYHDKNHAYPDTKGNFQTACAFEKLDVLCQLRSQVAPQSLVDPRGDAQTWGYWYASDGKTYAVFASLEGPPTSEETCVPRDQNLARKPNLLCIIGN